jgi:hypothetical protein
MEADRKSQGTDSQLYSPCGVNAMIPHLVEAKHIEGHKIWLRFDEGAWGPVDWAHELDGPVFEPLQGVEFFRRFVVCYHTLSWQNGADFAPEFLREKLVQQNLSDYWWG